MSSFIKNAKLGVKIGAGFSIVLLLLVVNSFINWDGLKTAKDGFVEYRVLAKQTNLVGRLQVNMLMIRMNVKDYLLTKSEKDRQQYEEYHSQMTAYLKDAHQEITDPERQRIVDEYSDNVKTYNEGFQNVVRLTNQVNKIADSKLRTLGPLMQKDLVTLMESAKSDDNVEAAYQAGLGLSNMLEGRIYGQKFLSDYDADSVES